MLKCSLCGQEFQEVQINEYVEHVQKCGEAQKIKNKAKEIKMISSELEELKRMQKCYEGMRDDFARRHPEVYKEHFQEHECAFGAKKPNLVDVTDEMNDKIPEFIKDIAAVLGAEIKVLTEV